MDEDNNIDQKNRRSSAFSEIGPDGIDTILDDEIRHERPKLQVRFRSNLSVVEPPSATVESEPTTPLQDTRRQAPSPLSQKFSLSQIPIAQMSLLLALIALAFPTFMGSLESSSMTPAMAEAGPIMTQRDVMVKRQTAETDICKRWSGQSALVNGTLYYYGGRATTSADQTTDQWNNDFLSLDLDRSWQISSPSLTGLPAPSGPPPVSLGHLWHSSDSLYLYGGQFSDAPVTSPVPFSLWSYEIGSSSWNEHANPTFEDGAAVQRAAEGAGVSVPGLGLGYYFGGHLDGYTTPGWSQSVPREYLPSMLEFTMPGFTNSELSSDSAAGSDGAYRNITVGSAGFPERADSSLVYVPGYSDKGIIIGLAGGTNQSFTQLNIIDVYDIATSTWYKQATEGPTPGVRVNPCAVAASSADGSSTQIYMYGGQNLIPYGTQTQYDDIWILTVPSFTWIEVGTGGQSVPPARAGHTCNIWNGQMVVVGGYVGQDLSCDSPGVYVFNTSSLEWQSNYVALEGGDDLNRQKSQKDDVNALQGSYGYQVPPSVQEVVGGNAVGGATVTAPAQTPTSGPLATGGPATYTVTGADGSVVTETARPGSSANSGGKGGPNIGAIVAGVIAGLLFLVVLYLAFCAYIYRKQLKLYKNHVAMAQRDALTSDTNGYGMGGGGFLGLGGAAAGAAASNSRSGGRSSNEKISDRNSSDNRSANSGAPGSSNRTREHELMDNYPGPYGGVYGDGVKNGTLTARSSTDDLLKGQEPSFLGVLLSPRRSLRVVNKD